MKSKCIARCRFCNQPLKFGEYHICLKSTDKLIWKSKIHSKRNNLKI